MMGHIVAATSNLADEEWHNGNIHHADVRPQEKGPLLIRKLLQPANLVLKHPFAPLLPMLVLQQVGHCCAAT